MTENLHEPTSRPPIAMYILSGKGSVAGVDLSTYILKKCQDSGILWDDDLPEYTIDFLTQTPSVSKSIREGKDDEVVDIFNRSLRQAEHAHHTYMLLCLTAHQLIPRLRTTLECVDLWDEARRRIDGISGDIAFLGTPECLPTNSDNFAVLPNHTEQIGDLITSVKRGYARLGENYAAHPRHLLKRIFDYYQRIGISHFFLACTDLHLCKKYLLEFGVPEENVIDILEIAGDKVIKRKGRKYTTEFLDATSDALTHFRYKYLSGSDSPQTDVKTRYFHDLLEKLPPVSSDEINILDIGGSSSGHSITIAEKLSPRHCNITIQDISKESLDAAKPLYKEIPNVSATFECGDISNFADNRKYDVVLCLGLLLCISRDEDFENTVRNIAKLTRTNGVVITRDCLSDAKDKAYMKFGGVIRNETNYTSAFHSAGLKMIEENSFFIKEPIFRKIKSSIWKKL